MSAALIPLILFAAYAVVSLVGLAIAFLANRRARATHTVAIPFRVMPSRRAAPNERSIRP